MSAVPKPRETLRMMIVDDSNVMRRRIERSQQNDRLEVVGTAVNGLDAVTKFKQLLPDVMTLDLTMPEMDGIECVEHVLKIKSDVLILVVSALADKATAVEAIEKGANGFLCKPFTVVELNAALAELIGE
jgi:two-component system chemotaxis response regulator CheY